ncbi:MAG TPA: DUF3052 domain-containing protein [Candidatus Udaeobacter sp.]|jgi:hypothetical protein|nr:DUF3052 domain-containing protein [Candidatus Udaeobacter sp.]
MCPGYSKTPLATKLGIRDGTEIVLACAPPEFLQAVAPLPSRSRIAPRLSSRTDIVHVFATRRAALSRALKSYRARIRPDAAVWVSWPKQSSKVPTDVTEDVVREVALPLGFVDIKVCAVTDVWSGLKLVVRKELR